MNADEQVFAVHGFVVIGPRGMMPGTFHQEFPHVRDNAAAVVILNRYDAEAVMILPAVLLVPPSAAVPSKWGARHLDPALCVQLNAKVADIQRRAKTTRGRVRGGRSR